MKPKRMNQDCWRKELLLPKVEIEHHGRYVGWQPSLPPCRPRWLGARRCFSTSASRLLQFIRSCFAVPLFRSLPFPVMLGLVFSDFLYILFGPKANLHAPQRLRGRSLNSLLTHPAMEGRGSDIENRRYLQRGIIFHRYDDAPCIICQEEK